MLALVVVWLLFAGVAGCTWVPLTDAAERVRVAASQGEVEGCREMGWISARTKSRVGIVSRGAEKVREELASLARNDAVGLGADTILADGEPTIDGTQRFRAYRCKRS